MNTKNVLTKQMSAAEKVGPQSQGPKCFSDPSSDSISSKTDSTWSRTFWNLFKSVKTLESSPVLTIFSRRIGPAGCSENWSDFSVSFPGRAAKVAQTLSACPSRQNGNLKRWNHLCSVLNYSGNLNTGDIWITDFFLSAIQLPLIVD